MSSFRHKYRKFTWVLTVLIGLASAFSFGWECSGAMAAPSAATAKAQKSCCKAAAMVAAMSNHCHMPCCPENGKATAPARQKPAGPATCMSPKSTQPDAIITDAHHPVVAFVTVPVPALLLPEIKVSTTRQTAPAAIFPPPREGLACRAGLRAPPVLSA